MSGPSAFMKLLALADKATTATERNLNNRKSKK